MPKIKYTLLPRSQIYFVPLFLMLVLSTVLSACTTQPVVGDLENTYHESEELTVEQNVEVSEQVKSKMPVATDEVEGTGLVVAQKQVKLDADSLFNLLAAEFASNVGDTKTALKHFRLAAKSIADSRLAARTAYVALHGEKYDEALMALDRWRALEPDAADLTRMYAIVWLKLDQPEKSVPYIEELLSSAFDTPVEKAIAVKAFLAKEVSTKNAYVILQKLNAGEDKNIHLLVLQARYAAQLGKYDESLVILDQVLAIDPSMHEVLIIKAKILSDQGKYEKASALIKQVVEQHPENTALRQQYGRMLVRQNSLQAAIEQYSILHEQLPDDSDITLSLALLHIETNNLDKAVIVLEHLVVTGKQVSIANYYLARIAQNKGDKKQAIVYYLQVNDGDYVFDAQLRVGVLLSVSGSPGEGLAKLEELAAAHSDWALRVRVYLAQGEVLRKLQRYYEGVEMFSRALQQNPEDINLLYARGLMAVKIDRLDIMEADLLKVIAIEPDNADALNALGYTLADRTTRHKEALAYIQRANELKPGNAAIFDSLGWVKYRLGRIDEALKWLSKAFEKLKDAEIAAHYGEVLWYSNQKDKAREVWREGKEINADHPVLIETIERLNPWEPVRE